MVYVDNRKIRESNRLNRAYVMLYYILLKYPGGVSFIELESEGFFNGKH
jgi:hypothetical protein